MPKLPGTDGRKMSKSYGNTILLTDSEPPIRAELKPMVTDPARIRRTDPGNPDVCPVFDLHKVFSSARPTGSVHDGCRTAGIGCIECKGWVADADHRRSSPPFRSAATPTNNPSLVTESSAKAQEAPRPAPNKPCATSARPWTWPPIPDKARRIDGPPKTPDPKPVPTPGRTSAARLRPAPKRPIRKDRRRCQRRGLAFPFSITVGTGLRRPARPPARPHPQAGHRHLRHPHRAASPRSSSPTSNSSKQPMSTRRRIHLHRLAADPHQEPMLLPRDPDDVADGETKIPAVNWSSACSSTSASKTPPRCCPEAADRRRDLDQPRHPRIPRRGTSPLEPEIAADTVDLVRVFQEVLQRARDPPGPRRRGRRRHRRADDRLRAPPPADGRQARRPPPLLKTRSSNAPYLHFPRPAGDGPPAGRSCSARRKTSAKSS